MLNGTTALTPSDVVQLLMQMSGQDDRSIHALVDGRLRTDSAHGERRCPVHPPSTKGRVSSPGKIRLVRLPVRPARSMDDYQ